MYPIGAVTACAGLEESNTYLKILSYLLPIVNSIGKVFKKLRLLQPGADLARAPAALADHRGEACRVMPCFFTRHLQQSKMGPAQNMRFGAVAADHAPQAFHHLPAMFFQFHINKINYNNAPGITQPDQPANLLCSQQIRTCYRLFESRSAGILSRIDINDG